MRTILLLALSLILYAGDQPAVDHDALAAQRHAEAQARDREAQAEAKRRQDAEEADRAAKQPKAWPVPDGKAADEVPAWARGDWMRGGDSLVIGARTFGPNGGAPIKYRQVVVGDGFCWVELDVSSGASDFGWVRMVLRQDGGRIYAGGPAKREKRMVVDAWVELAIRK